MKHLVIMAITPYSVCVQAKLPYTSTLTINIHKSNSMARGSYKMRRRSRVLATSVTNNRNDLWAVILHLNSDLSKDVVDAVSMALFFLLNLDSSGTCVDRISRRYCSHVMKGV